MKWFEEVNLTRPAVICSRVRLVRNLEEYAFPSRLDEQQADEMIGRLEEALKGLGSVDGRHYEQARLQELSDLDRRALRERRVFNSTIASGKAPAGVMVSDDEQVGIVLNGTDHIRIQLFAAGLHLDELMNQAGQIDDYLNERFDYAFDEKYGYLTSFPTSVGTGLRASVVLHLPLLSQSKRFMRDCGYRGILAIEYFVKGDEVYFNEMAPRPHNSGHWTIEGSTTNQFRELCRYLLDMPLEEPQLKAPTVMKNILGQDLERAEALARENRPGVYVHIYGKTVSKPKRKMGHVTFVGVTGEEYAAKWADRFVK